MNLQQSKSNHSNMKILKMKLIENYERRWKERKWNSSNSSSKSKTHDSLLNKRNLKNHLRVRSLKITLTILLTKSSQQKKMVMMMTLSSHHNNSAKSKTISQRHLQRRTKPTIMKMMNFKAKFKMNTNFN